ncbi:DUF302 domain-containing protein [Texcoconibacillus texcoconensis]|uniref:Uncharacterized protein (DUF302 family) n=1 Tax=Texcoconibacillus texcoconensis TaxID=1095777 RepID=A0A840QLR2_9BACI|nr:DUF302 domain-containing protein [Texcoconibacillus texcoconensis]MBB5172307.1 uncharacterized protein (DUF302 family) [Texcoconibacillus texcoconensis]
MFHYTVETTNDIQETIESLKVNLQEEKFGVLWELSITDKLQEKGVDFDKPYYVFEVCNPHEAKKLLSASELAGYFLPCKVVVYEEGGKTKIGLPKPTTLFPLVENDEVKEAAEDIEKRLIDCLEKST